MFLILLRTAIGWHFLYEGTQKILSTQEGKSTILANHLPIPEGPSFSSEAYLREATGPFAPRFRALIPDPDSLEKMDLGKLKEAMAAEVDRVATYYDFDDKQRDEAKASLKNSQKVADDWFESVENRRKVRKYLDDLNLANTEAAQRKPDALEAERLNAQKNRKDLESTRKELVKEFDTWTGTLRDAVVKLATDEQIKARAEANKPGKFVGYFLKEGADSEKIAGAYRPTPSSLDQIDRVTMYGLTLVGLCLMLGFCTPLAALGGAAYLLSFYLSMPPFPGLPESPKVEGHYLIVNKNLIEMLACLALASTPNGLWVGLDALFFGWIGRGRRRRELAEALAVEAQLQGQGGSPTASTRPTPTDRRKFKSR